MGTYPSSVVSIFAGYWRTASSLSLEAIEQSSDSRQTVGRVGRAGV